ncbi:MAG: helix-turn-helix domain-containing protein [Defluviitaleaceae bacterium]|nr:helix-turn-helix domain-containing protein [Defluviitaleaceae bacterium]
MYKRLRDLRTDKDLNQTQMGKILGMSQTGYSQYEIGKNDVPSEILRKLAIYHNTSVDYLLELTDQREPYPKSKKRKLD